MQSMRLQESGSCPKIPQGDISKPRKATLADGRDQRMRTTKPLYQRKLPPMHQLLIRAIDLRVPTSRETLMDLDFDRRVGAQALKPSLVSSKLRMQSVWSQSADKSTGNTSTETTISIPVTDAAKFFCNGPP